MPADSLLNMARRACGRYSGRITDIGDLSYEVIRPVLLKINSPEKLHQLETNSPQIIGKDAEIWLSFIKRDIPDWQNKRHEPKDPKNWWKVYRKLKQEAQMDISQGEDKLRAALDNIKNEKEQNVAQLMSKTDVPRQQTGRRQRITYNYMSGKTGSKGAHKLTLMEKIKKEARDAKTAKMGRPMHELQKRATVVSRPPQQFVEDLKQKIPMSPTKKIKLGHHEGFQQASNMGPRLKRPEVGSSYNIIQDREARLRALKSGKSIPTSGQGSIHNQSTELRTNNIPEVLRRQSDGLSSSFLEDFDETEGQPSEPLNDHIDRPRFSSPGKISSPQPRTMKRKQAPALFMSPAKKVFRRPEVT